MPGVEEENRKSPFLLLFTHLSLSSLNFSRFPATALEMSTSVGESSGTASGEIMLFGVRLVVDSMRKSVSLNNLSQYSHPQDALVTASADKDVAAGYASADESAAGVLNRSPSSIGGSNRERKRGVPWTEEEHKMFLLGLQKVGKGDWRGISKTFVKTRTPTQVASHAQKHFLRRCNLNRRRRRSSLFDITTETVSGDQVTDQNASKVDLTSQSPQPHTSVQGTSSEISNISFSVTPMVPPAGIVQYMPEMNPNNINNLIQSTPVVPADSTTMTNFNPNHNSPFEPSPISLNLSLSLSSGQGQPAYQAVPSFSNGDSMINVA